METRNEKDRAERVYQRTYKACIPCRRRKAKCELGTGPDGLLHGPPCLRCRREQRDCQFSAKRAWGRSEEKRKRGSPEEVDLESSPKTPQPHTTSVGRVSEMRNSRDAFATPCPRPQDDGVATDARGISSEDGPSHKRRRSASSLGTSMMRTVVTSGNDALNILFEAAASHRPDLEQPNPSEDTLSSRSQTTRDEDVSAPHERHPGNSRRTETHTAWPVYVSQASRKVLGVWEACRFVKMGWLTSREAVTLIDLFFKNMSPLSPILTDFYADHENHYRLLTYDPVLCSTILMISSRYHVLPGAGGMSRNFFIHHRLWQHCQQLVMRLTFGQDKSTSTKIRGIGTIEALLMMSEWHPRSLHFPPEVDGWDCDLMVENPESQSKADSDDETSTNRWLEDMIEPAKRSDQMSWMLLGSALSLAHNLGVFENDDKELNDSSRTCEDSVMSSQTQIRRQRIQRLLYVYINQLSWRIGCISLMPQSLNRAILRGQTTGERSRTGDGWITFMDAWMDLTKLAKSVTDTFFPSVSFARQQLNSGRYVDLLDHFRPLLTHWKDKYLHTQLFAKPLFNVLFIEYHFVRVYTHSVGMQAVVERVLADGEPSLDEMRPLNIDSIDYEYIQEVIDGCCQILHNVIQLAETGSLRFSPVRTFLRITSSSIFLMKALSLGARQSKLRESLDVLEKTIQALETNALDDIHLSSRYATLLDMHVSRLRHHLLASSWGVRNARGTAAGRSSAAPSTPRPDSGPRPSSSSAAAAAAATDVAVPQDLPDMGFTPSLNDMAADDWLSLPFDPSMAPFGVGSGGQFPAYEGGALDFIWNLPS